MLVPPPDDDDDDDQWTVFMWNDIYKSYVTLEHKTSHNGQFCEIEMYASSESWINNICIDVWFGQYLKIWGCKKNQNIEKIIFKIVQMKFLAMHITNQ